MMRSYFVIWTAVALTAVAGGAVAAPPQVHPNEPLVSTPAGPATAFAARLRERFGSEVRIAWDDAWQAPRRLSGLAVPTAGPDAGARALGFLAATRNDFAAGASTWRVTRVQALPGGGTVVRCAVLLGELPVEGREVVVQLDDAQRVVRVTRDPGPAQRPATTMAIDAAQATQIAFGRYEVAAVGKATAVVLATTPGTERIAWRVPVARLPLSGHFFVWLDAETGATLRTGPAGFDEAMGALTLRRTARSEGSR